MAKYRIIRGEIKFHNDSPDGVKGVGEIVELREVDGDEMVASGVVEKVVEAAYEKPDLKVVVGTKK